MDDGDDRYEALERENDALRSELAQLRACLEELQRLAHAGYWSHDLATGEIQWSDYMFSLLGVERREVTPAWIFSLIHPADVPVLLTAMERASQGDQPGEQEFRIVTASGEERVLVNRWLSRFDEAGNEVSRSGAHVDITETRRVEADRARLQQQFLQAQRQDVIGRLASGVAHDFNNLLTVIVGSADLAQAGLPPDSPAREELDMIARATLQASDLSHRLVALSRPRADGSGVSEVGEALRQVEPLIARAVGDRTRVSWTLPPEPLWARVETTQLHQLVLNLVLNARDAMPDGGDLTIEAVRAPADNAPGAPDASDAPVRLSVSDTGVGIAPELRQRLFEPHFTTKGPGEGSGLGLASVREIADAWGARLELESAPGRGSCFRVTFAPAAAPTPSEAPPEGSAGEPGGTEAVAVCDDSELVREVLRQLLSRAGYSVSAFTTPAAAIAAAEEGLRPDLLIADLDLPGLSGHELAARLERLAPGLPALYLTARPESTPAPIPEGAPLLRKPFTRRALLAEVRALLDR